MPARKEVAPLRGQLRTSTSLAALVAGTALLAPAPAAADCTKTGTTAGGGNRIECTGTQKTDIDLGSTPGTTNNADTLTNDGALEATANLMDGDDTYINVWGARANNVFGGPGSDTLKVTGADGDVQVNADIYYGFENYTNSAGSITTVTNFSGDTTVTTDRLGPVLTGSGDDTVTVSRGVEVAGAIISTAGADTITVEKNAVVYLGIASGDGNDTIILEEGATVGDGSSISGTRIAAGSGDDTVKLKAGSTVRRGDVDLGSDDDTLVAHMGSVVHGAVDGGGGDDSVTVQDGVVVSGIIDGQGGTNDLTVRGEATIHGQVSNFADVTATGGGTKTFGGGLTAGTLDVTVPEKATFDATANWLVDASGETVKVSDGIAVDVTAAGTFSDGATLKVIRAGTLTNNGSLDVTGETPLVNLAGVTENNNLKVEVTYKDQPDGASGDAADALSGALTATQGDPEAFQALAGLNENETQDAGEQLTGDANAGGGVAQAVASTGNQNMSIAAGRLASLRPGERYAARGETGLAAGDGGLSRAVWVKPYAKTGNRDERDGVAGYDSDTQGIMGGADMAVGDGFRVGGAFGYAGTDVEGEGAAQSTQDVDSYQVTAYGDYTADTWYVEGMAAYGYNSVDTTSRITFGGLNRTRRGGYTAHQYSARVRGGVPFALGGGQTLTPSAGFQYTHIDNESYTTTGAGGLNQRVDPADVNKAIAMAGATYSADVATANGTLTPEVRARALYDFAADDPEQTRTYTGGGASFSTTGADVAELGGKLGAGLTYATADGRWSLSADYDMEVKEDFLGHTGQLEARYHF